MINITKKDILCLSLLIWLASCSEKPTIQIRTTIPVANKSESSLLSSELQATATLRDEDWQKLHALFQSILPRIAAMEYSILWLPQGTMMVIAELQAQLEISAKLLKTTESLLTEAQETRKVLEKMAMPSGEQ